MIQPIMKDPLFLAQKSEEAAAEDLPIAEDLADTLKAHLDHCVGMAANMIGKRKRIIAVCNGPVLLTMINPRITVRSGRYEAEEGCLSLQGTRKAVRYREITVTWQDTALKQRTGTFRDFPAQIIQHEIDHCDGILI
ncbi:MAG: peptide deformylase [Clostridia bacterium]|nr:peptide deformylase [Clostridia bacterium]